MACARPSLVDTCRRLTYDADGPYQATGTPASLDHKYITEDVPVGLIPMSALGAAAGVPTPAIDALIETVRNMIGKDFAAEARTLDRLGLAGMDLPQIRRVVDEGFRRRKAQSAARSSMAASSAGARTVDHSWTATSRTTSRSQRIAGSLPCSRCHSAVISKAGEG